MQNKNNKDTIQEQKDSKLTELHDDALELIAGGLGEEPFPYPIVSSSMAETCPSFQWCTIVGDDILYIKCCENCNLHVLAARQFPQIDAFVTQNGRVLCGLKK